MNRQNPRPALAPVFRLCIGGFYLAKNSQGGKAVAKTIELATPLAESLGFSIWDVVFEKEGATWYLRVYIDKPEGMIDLADCEAFHRPFNKILDEEDFIKEKDWTFETCSPGLGRKLRKEEHYEKYRGSEIRVCLIRAVDGEKEIVGTLDSFTKDAVTVSGREIPFSDTAYIKLNDDAGLFDE